LSKKNKLGSRERRKGGEKAVPEKIFFWKGQGGEGWGVKGEEMHYQAPQMEQFTGERGCHPRGPKAQKSSNGGELRKIFSFTLSGEEKRGILAAPHPLRGPRGKGGRK